MQNHLLQELLPIRSTVLPTRMVPPRTGGVAGIRTRETGSFPELAEEGQTRNGLIRVRYVSTTNTKIMH